jgi:hypothetical protein
MSTGLLEVTGTISVTQFWPTGESDADIGRSKCAGSQQLNLETFDFLNQGNHAVKLRPA